MGRGVEGDRVAQPRDDVRRRAHRPPGHARPGEVRGPEFDAGLCERQPERVDERLPVVVINTREAGNKASELRYEKTHSNIVEVKAREGIVISILTEGDQMSSAVSDHVLEIPNASDLLAPVLAVIPLQLLAYHIAVRRGCDVDQPRNLAKSVTVE